MNLLPTGTRINAREGRLALIGRRGLIVDMHVIDIGTLSVGEAEIV